MRVALVHDYLTQRGGAERVVLSLLRAFPGAPLYTSLYQPETTFPELAGADVLPMALNRVGALRRDHRRALPLLGPAFRRLRVDADVVVCSSSGWAHGVRASGRKVVYCYTPAHWLYDGRRYLGEGRSAAGAALAALRPWLVGWDRRAARSADRYLTLSSAVRDRIRSTYGIESEVLAPPPTLDPAGPAEPVAGVAPGFFLCVSRLLPYKNVDVVAAAFDRLPAERLVVVGTGPHRARLAARSGSNVTLLGTVSDAELRWLYDACAGVVSASYEDYGLTPLEGASFAKPAAVLGAGGFLDTVVEGRTGVLFGAPPRPQDVAEAVAELGRRSWDPDALRAQAAAFGEDRFVERIRRVVAEEAR